MTLIDRVQRRYQEGDAAGLEPRTLELWTILAVVGEVVGLSPLRLTSGRRSAAWQAMLRERWEQGDREGLMAPPAAFSWHTRGKAFDVSSNPDLDTYGAVWKALAVGNRWGGSFRPPDRGHFDTGAA
jgi:uncharacterized protein YcbK (DUF882 family)